MSFQEQVKGAHSPQEALEYIARALDMLENKIDRISEKPLDNPDPWGKWEEPDPDDPEDMLAAQARRTLETDDGTIHFSEPLPQGDRVKVIQTENGVEVEIPPPTENQLERRELFADEVLAKHYDWDHDRCMTFVRGGPLLLYYSDPEMVKELPPLWHKQFVEDVETNSPEEAHEMARDILKESQPDTQALTIENLKRDLENLHG